MCRPLHSNTCIVNLTSKQKDVWSKSTADRHEARQLCMQALCVKMRYTVMEYVQCQAITGRHQSAAALRSHKQNSRPREIPKHNQDVGK